MSRRVAKCLVVPFILAVSAASAFAWDAGGTPVCTLPGAQVQLQPAVSDGDGGTLIAWADTRNGSGGPSGLYVSRLAANGERFAGWPENGVFVSTTSGGSLTPRVCDDGSGGAYVVWNAVRDRAPWTDVLATHVLGDGTLAPGWPVGGLVVCDTTSQHRDPVCVGDGSDGVIVVWRDERDDAASSSDLYAQRLTFGGQVAAGWPRQGAPVTRSPLYDFGPLVAADGDGGVWVTWREIVNSDGFVQHLGATGQPVGAFPANGLRLRPGTGLKHPQSVTRSPDGSALIVWYDERADVGGAPSGTPGLYATRFVSDTTRAAGWPATGRALPSFPWGHPLAFTPPVGSPDGGAVFAWMDDARTVRVGRIDAEAALPAGWTADGVVVSAPGEPAAVPVSLLAASDGDNGAFAAWSLTANDWPLTPGTGDVRVSHVLGSGALEAGWPASGLAVEPTPAFEYATSIVPDAGGGVVVVFQRGLQDSMDLFAARALAGGVVPVHVSLVAARWNGAAIDVEWFLGEPPARVDVQRDAGAGWTRVATLAPDGSGRVAWSDADIAPGRAYAYRLSWSERGETFTGGDTRVEVPARALSMAASCAPGADRAEFRLVLAPGSPARLTLHDLQGRLVARLDIAAGEPTRLLALPTGALPAGVYLARLEQDRSRVGAKFVVSR